MRTSLMLASILLFFFMLLVTTFAVPFTPTSSPTGLNAGQSSQLVNFTIQNIGSVNITQLNITLPSRFTFTGSSGTTTSLYTASSSTPSWTNTTAVGIVGNGATQYFWVYVNTPSATGGYSFNITTLDASGVFNSSNVSFTIFDILAPTYSSNTTSPSSNSTYSANQSYWFNITWTDGGGISRVLIEHNITGSGTTHNDTMSNSSSVYYLNVTDLAAGTYVWKVYANDTNNTGNSTLQFTYVIRQASNEIRAYLNGTLNSNITSVNNTAVNITVNTTCIQQGCNITIVRDNGVTLIQGGPTSYSKPDDIITSVGLHNYSISVTGNTNYTSNSSVYFFVATVPSYTTSINTPLTYSNTTKGYINITFTNNPSLSNMLLQGAWTGTSTNHTFSNSSVTSYSYSTVFPAGTQSWTIYGTYSNHTFNLTSNSFTINKAAPTLTLNITPQWILDTPIETNASCTQSVSGLTANLYRNGTSVSNPDTQSFSASSIYEYLCNNTINVNYTADSVKNTLIIRPKASTALSFVQAAMVIEITQNSTATSEIKVKNTGNVAQSVTLEISGLDKSWYSISPVSTNILISATATFTITFNVGNVDVKDYSGKTNASSTNATISQDFKLRVLPSAETKLKINDTIDLYKLDVSKLESKFGEIKTKVNNTALIEQKMTELKTALKQAEDYINSNNYFQAQQTFETIKALISEVENQLKAAETTGIKVNIPSNIWLIIIGVVVVVVIGFMVYLFWPVKKGYKPETGYVYGGEEKKGLFDAFKNLLSKFKRKKKTETVLPEG